MPACDSESLILRTYPYREADLVVSFVSRDQGKLRGIARGARRPKSRWGSGLESLSHVRLFYFLRENQDLARLDRCELQSPPLFLKADYPVSVALAFVAEVSERLLPEHEPNDAHFRLLLLVLDEMKEGVSGKLSAVDATSAFGAAGPVVARNGPPTASTTPRATGPPSSDVPVWLRRTLDYFALWSLRLGGWLAPLNVCTQSGVVLGPEETAYFDHGQDGLYSADFKTADSWPLSASSRQFAHRMLHHSLPDLRGSRGPSSNQDDLFQFLTQRLEFHFEQRLKTAAVLSQL